MCLPDSASKYFLVLLGALGSTTGCGRSASAQDCRAIAEHYLDLAVQESAGKVAMSSAQLAAVRQVEEGIKHAEPGYRMVLDRCREVDRTAVSCALHATTATAWETCLRASEQQ